MDYITFLLCSAIVVTLVSFHEVSAQQLQNKTCFACSYTFGGDGTTDKQCVIDPGSGGKRDCAPDIPGDKVLSFHRGCLPKGVLEMSLTCLESAHDVTCDMYCKTSYCNWATGARDIPDDTSKAAHCMMSTSTVFIVALMMCARLLPIRLWH